MISERIFRLLRQVPKCKVITYKALAEQAGTSPRVIGQVMRRNKYLDRIPCYKVVMSDGSLGGYTHPKGIKEKIRRLKKDGIKIRNGKIDKKYFCQTVSCSAPYHRSYEIGE